MITKIHYPKDGRYYVELDPDQIIPDNPGEGTPELVCYEFYDQLFSATLNCAVGTGELSKSRGYCVDDYRMLPDDVWNWLANDSIVATAIEAMYEEAK